MFSFDVSVLTVVDRRQLFHGLLQRSQYVFEFSLLAKNEVEFLLKSHLVNLDTLDVRVELSNLRAKTKTCEI